MTDATRPRQAAGVAGADLLFRHFEALCRLQPHAPAVAWGEWRLSYADVNGAANRLAHRLLALGAARNVPVALCLPRGPDLLVAMLAVMKAGAAYVPFDPAWPRPRLQLMHDAVRPPLLVTRATLREELPGAADRVVVDLDRDGALIGAQSPANPDERVLADQWCYVLFTSGSTGAPKGVPVTHGNLVNLFPPLVSALDLGPADIWTWLHSPAFGFSVWEIWGAWRQGGSIVVVPEHLRHDPVALGELLVEERVTVFSQTPSGYRRLVGVPDFHRSVARSALRYVALSGEALRGEDIGAWTAQRHAARLISTYAVTETGGQVTLRRYGPGDATEAGGRNLGQPLAGRHVLVLDAAGHPLAAGEAGELWVGGDTVAAGYLAAEPGAQRFGALAVPGVGPVHGYRTGDRVRQLDDGSLEYLGRLDAQLKFRGFRIEPGDIETSLREHPDVRDAVVGVRPDAAGSPRLTAWVVGTAGTVPAAVQPAAGAALEFWPSLGAWGVYDRWLYGLMNAEPVRLAAYRAAFAASVRDRVVLDIGTGEDAVLARLCVEAGAAHVYAVEVLEPAADRARDLVRHLGLQDRITVLHGDMRTLALPQPVSVCTQGIIGNIGSADGIAGIWNAARRHFAPGCVAVPGRCLTRIAPMELPAGARAAPRFGPLAADYARRVFATAGHDFDLRLCVRNVPRSALLAAPADFEDLDFSGELPIEHAGSARLTAERDGHFDGCLLWTVVTAGAGQVVDYLNEQQAWLPVYLPLADEPLPVRRGDVIELEWRCYLESDPDFPDYRVTVRLPGAGGTIERCHVTRHRESITGDTALHRALLASLATAPAPLSVTTLRHWLESRVPEHLVPQSWVFLPELPLGPGGKLDRDALPAPAAMRPRLAAPAVAPRGAAEAALAALWSRALGLEGLGVADNFFELGGDSITAVQLTTAIQRWLDAAVPLAALFQAPTIAGLAAWLAEHHGAALTAALQRAEPEPVPAPAVAAGGELPLTFPQQSLWFLQSLYAGDTSASEQFVFRLSGPLDEAALGAAWTALLARHPVLTTTFITRGDGVRQRPGSAPVGPPARRDLAGDRSALEELAAAELARPFDLGSGPLLRALLCRVDTGEYWLIATAHHIVADGLSVPVLQRDLAALYAAARSGATAALPSPAPGYAVLAARSDWQAGSSAAADLDGWRKRLANPPPDPLDALVRPPAGERMAHRQPFVIDAVRAGRLRALARATGTTPFMLLLAAFRTLLARLTGQDDVPVGTPLTLRDAPELQEVVGCLVNPVVLRTAIDTAGSFRDHLVRERSTVLDALQAGRTPFARIVEAVAPERVLGRHPLFQVLFSWEPEPPPVPPAAGVQFELRTLPVARASYFELECAFRDAGDGAPLTGHITWAANAIEEPVARQLPAWLVTLLDGILAAPDAPLASHSLLGSEERHRVLHEWNATDAEFPRQSLAGYFLAQAQATPGAPALRTPGIEWSYAELAARSSALAAALSGHGVVPGSVVGLALGRTPAAVVAVLAVLRAGGIVLPLDPSYPASRLQYMARDAGLRLLLAASDALAARFAFDDFPVLVLDPLGQPRGTPADGARPPAVVPVAPDAPAFILYTSGSTGEPKGAVTTHQCAVNRCHWLWQAYPFGPADVFALRTTLNFIDAWWEIFGALGHGIPLEIVPDDIAGDALALPGWLQARGITQLVLVPSLLEALLDSLPVPAAPGEGVLPRLRWCITSGEPLSPALASRCRQLLPGMRLINTYGTSEIWDAAAFDATAAEAGALRVPVGRPVANARVYVLDARGEPLPPWIPGELCVGGIGIGPGYWRQPGLTAARYVPDRLSGRPGRLYRSGDRARFLPDGNLECLGRLDAQVQLRGFRVEPAEIEAALGTHPGVQAASVAVVGEGAGARLRAGIVPATPGPAAALIAALRAHLADRLPPHLLPTDWCIVDALPRTPSGKLDRRALAAVPAVRAATAADDASALPRTDAGRRLAALWCEVLGVARADPGDNFFACGGHSLLAVRLMNRIRASFGVALPLRALFEAPTPGELAARLAVALGEGALPTPAAIAPRPRQAPLPLSFGQERLWFLAELDPGNAAANVAFTVRCTGALDEALLQAALGALAARHEPLRTRFPAPAGEPCQVIEAPGPVVLGREDLEAATPASVDAALRRLAAAPFDLGQAPLWRATLLRLRPGEHLLLLTFHHIITDATSNRILFDELAALYAAGGSADAARLPPLPVQYADVAAWQRTSGDAAERAAELAWWRARLSGAPPLLELPADRARPAEQSFAGATLHRQVPPELSRALEALARETGCTLFMTLLAGFKALLHRWTGAADILVGTPVEGRLRPEVENLVGFFINTLVLRTDLGGDPSFGALLARVRETTVEAQARQSLPFEQLVEVLAPERSLSRSPVFQLMFNLLRVPDRTRRAGAVAFHLDRLVDPGVSPFDLTLTAACDESTGALSLGFEYATALFDAATIDSLADSYLALLGGATRAPDTPLSRLPVLDARLRERLLHWGAPAGPQGAALPVPSVIAAWAERTPDAPALSLAGTTVTYRALESQSNRLARALLRRGVGPGQRVGIGLARGPAYVIAVLGVLKAGLAYVPLDPDYPAARLAWMAADAGLSLLIVGPGTRAPFGACGVPLMDLEAEAAVLDAEAATPPAIVPSAGSTAYVLYTSGTAGRPKGVVVSHGNLACTLEGWISAWAPAPGEAHLQMASAAFDVFTGDWVRALGTGGRLEFCPRETLLDPPALLALLAGAGIRIAEFVPAVMRLLLAELDRTGRQLPALRLLIVGSDAWYAGEYRALRARAAPGTRIINSYGVAEATIDSTWFEAADGQLSGDGPVPIGRPFAHSRVQLLDAAGQLVPPGVPGELSIGGPGVATGYLNQPALTAGHFQGEGDDRCYRTGDRARWNSEGQLVLQGRGDAQLKVRGWRVEPAEIEARLTALPGIRAAAVGRVDGDEGGQLVAWVVPDDPSAAGAALCAAALREALCRELPEALVPAAFIPLPALPLTPNGKIDRLALAQAGGEALPLRGQNRPPLTPVEDILCALFAATLPDASRAGPVGRDGNFFALGGHSLLATRLIARVRDALAVELPLRVLFEAPTPAGIAAAIAARRSATLSLPPLRRRPAGGGNLLPLSPMQQRLWFLEQLQPGTAAWHLHWCVRLRGALDLAALERAWNALIARHASLRTSFSETDGVPAQVVAEATPAPLGRHRPSGLQQLLNAPFDLRRGPLVRLSVAEEGAGEWSLVLVVHHLVADGWSLGLLGRDLAAFYAGDERAPLPIDYADYALWQVDALAGDALRAELDWWRERLRDAPAVLRLPRDSGADIVSDPAGAWLTRHVPAAQLAALRALALAEGATLFMVLLAGFTALLGRLAATDDVVVGTPVAGRAHTALEELVGFFVNTLALRTDLSGDPTFRELLARVRADTLAAFDHALVPFEKVVEAVQPPRSLAHSPLVQVLVVLHNQPRSPLALRGLEVLPGDAPDDRTATTAVKFDLSLHLAEEADGLAVSLAWRTGLYGRARMEKLADAFARLLDDLGSTPDARLSSLLGPAPQAPAAGAPPAAAPAACGPADPVTPTEKELGALWQELLGLREIGVTDDFFVLGGHSLLAMRLVARIAARFGVALPLVSLFEAPTVRGLAGRIEAARGSGPPARPGEIPRLPRRVLDDGAGTR